MAPGAMPKGSPAAKERFLELVPKDPAVTTRPMFGHAAAFVNGNMFTGLFGEDLFVRLSDGDRDELLRNGGREFAPMPGRVMKGYVVLPGGWDKHRVQTAKWIDAALMHTRALPAKAPKAPGRAAPKKPAKRSAR